MDKKQFIDPRVQKPNHGQNCFFRTKNNNQVLIGFFVDTDRDVRRHPDTVGTFYVGTCYEPNFINALVGSGCARGIGFQVWKTTEWEVTGWLPIELPE